MESETRRLSSGERKIGTTRWASAFLSGKGNRGGNLLTLVICGVSPLRNEYKGNG